MEVRTSQWHTDIGNFNCHSLCLSKCKWDNNRMFLKIIFLYFLLLCRVLNTTFRLSKLAARLMFHWKTFFIWPLLYFCSLLLLHRNIESNPGPRNSKNYLPSFFHWNLNSLQARNFENILLLKAYNAIYKYDFICLSETYRISSITSDHVALNLAGYNLVREDHPNNVKRGGVCIDYKESLPVTVIKLSHLQEAFFLELNVKIIISSLYGSPSQNNKELEIFLTSFEHLLSDINTRKPSVSVIFGDLNTISFSWWSNDIDSLEGTKHFSLSTSNGFHQIVNEHISKEIALLVLI